MKLTPEIENKDKPVCEYLLKAFERLTEANRYSNPPKDLTRLGEIYGTLLNWVFSDEPVNTYEGLCTVIDTAINRMEDAALKLVVRRMFALPES